MYSRSYGKNDQPIRIPEHYSGSAFARPKAPLSRHENATRQPLPTPPPIPVQKEEAVILEEKPPMKEIKDRDNTTNEVGAMFDRLVGSITKSLSFDQLLLIGLILILSGCEGSSELILWLVLLLFV